MDTTPKPREAIGLWLIKIFAGFLIVFLLGLHFIVNHLVAPEGLLTWSDVVAYYQNPIIPIVEIIFLIVVVGHSLIGTRSIILDLNPTQKVMKVLDMVFILGGLAAIIYGIWLVFVIIGFGR